MVAIGYIVFYVAPDIGKDSDCIHIKKVKSISKVTRPHEEVCAGRVLMLDHASMWP